MSPTFSPGCPTIGVLAGWQYYWTATPLSYLNPIYRGIRQAAADLGCNLLLGCGMGPSAASTDPLRTAWPFPSSESDFVPIGPWNTDGLIAINPLHAEARSRDLQDLIAAGHPLVFVAAGEAGPTIVADNTSGIRDAMRHLVGHGHRRIAFIAGSPEDMAGDTGARFQAYRSALQEFGLPPDEHLIAYGRHITAGGYDAMRRIMDTGATFTAILASNDESALGAMEALREAGIRVPQDVAIIGFDDRPESAVQKPALTSVAVPLFEMGYRAVEQLLRQIQGEPPPVEQVKVATHLVPRESCGCGRSGTPPVRLVDTSGQVGISEAQEMPGAIAQTSVGATGSEPNEIGSLRQRLIAAFIASVERNDPAAFPDAVDAILFDDVAFGGTTPPPATWSPITFDASAVTYTLTGFGGAEDSTVVVDPTNAANKVAKVVKSATAELWAGTTVSTGPNFSVPTLPFTASNTTMTVRVWSPDAGIQVRLKAEDAADPTKSVETEATTTVANAWETLTFNFANQAPGTAALNLAYTYNKVSIFFNFGVTGATAGAKTYYFDDVAFVP